jgi:NADPH2:quinone reductase
VVAPAARLVAIPDGVSSAVAAAAMLQGMTAHYLSHSTCALRAGDVCLIHAAAGGVGLLLCQMAHRAGARVLATTSSDAKADAARAAGADEVIRYDQTDFADEVLRLTDGAGVRVAYDSVGKTTWEGSLRCLAVRGMLALFGQSSGVVAAVDPRVLQARSLFLTRPALHHYIVTREELEARAGDVLGWIASGELRITIDRELPLDEAGRAHELLESRQTSGKLLLRCASS